MLYGMAAGFSGNSPVHCKPLIAFSTTVPLLHAAAKSFPKVNLLIEVLSDFEKGSG